MRTHFDVAVLGLGAMGSAAVYQLAKQGVNVLGIDQFSPPHNHGSSHGDTRIIRQAIGEGNEYVPLVLRSYELFQEIEKKTGTSLLEITGGLTLANPDDDSGQHGVKGFLQSTIQAAETYGIEHSILSNAELRKRFPQFNVQDEVGYYEPSAGFLRPEECIQSQLTLAKQLGAVLRYNESVTSFDVNSGNDRVTVHTNQGTYEVGKIIFTVGPWIGQMLPDYSSLFKIFRQVLFWFDVEAPIEVYEPGNFPIFIWSTGKDIDILYGFPAIDGKSGGLKVATELYKTPLADPDAMEQVVSAEEIEEMQKHVVQLIPALTGKCIKAVACPYTVTPDSRFIIDVHPSHPNVIIASPCSGHGFKHSAAIGEILCDMALDKKPAVAIDAFSIGRFRI